MMFRFVLVLAFVSLSQQCCTPSAWEGDQQTLLTLVNKGQVTPTLVQGNYRTYYDAAKRMVSVRGYTTINNTQHNTVTIQDYNTRLQYDLYDSKCTKKQLPVFPGNCFPANATRYDTYFATGILTMPVQIYSFPMDGLQISMSVDSNCVPIGQTFYGNQQNQDMFGSSSFMNVVGRSSIDQSLFAIPSECYAAGLVG